MPARIEDYALIGDCETAALVSLSGSIDWLCWPRFDSGACFAALLGNPENGRWLMAPADDGARSTRRYRGDTMILETQFETDEGSVVVIDFMPLRDERSNIVRTVVGKRGSGCRKDDAARQRGRARTERGRAHGDGDHDQRPGDQSHGPDHLPRG